MTLEEEAMKSSSSAKGWLVFVTSPPTTAARTLKSHTMESLFEAALDEYLRGIRQRGRSGGRRELTRKLRGGEVPRFPLLVFD